MTNPLSNEGVSDKDFAAAVGIAMGETGSKRISKEEMAAVIDVAMNRLEGFDKDPHRATERSLHGVITARGQFDASNPRGSIGGRQKYDAGYNAIMNGAPVPANMRTLYDTAVKQAIGVLSKDGPWRGTARNAEYFSSTAKKLSRSEARMHAKLGKGTGTKIGASTFYGPEHTKQFGKRDAPTPARREAEYSKFGQEGTPREKLSQPFASEDYSKFGPLGTPREAIAPTAAPYSPASLDIGPDFTSPPSQARGPVENPYEFSNINPNAEVAPGSFAGYGPNAFGAVDQAPVDYGTTYPELSAGLYPDIAPPDVPAVPNVMGQFDVPGRMTEQEAIERAGLAGQRPSENVEVRPADYGRSIDEQIKNSWVAEETNDYLSALYGGMLGPAGLGRDVAINPAAPAFTTNPYENLAPAAVYGPDVPRTYPDISAGLYPDGAVVDEIRNAPTTPSPMTIENFNAIFGNMPDDSTGSVRDARMSASLAPTVNAPQVGGPYSFSSLESLRPAPDAAVIPGDVTGYGPGGAFSSRAPSPAFDFAGIVNDTAWSGPSPNVPAATAQPAQAPAAAPAESSEAFNARMSDALSPGLTGGMSPFQGTPLGVGQGIIDQGPYSSPIGYADKFNSFSPANLGNPMPNTAVSTQAPAAVAAPAREIVGYETITKDVPNPAWSEWSKDYATNNAAQNAWAAADEDKFGWDRAPPNPSALANTAWAFPDEPARTITVEQQGKPIYGPAPVVQAQPVSVPAIQAQPRVAAAPAASIPAVNARPAQAPLTAAPVGVGGWWDSFTNGLGNILGGMSLAGMGGDYAGYGQFGGGYDTSGGYGGYGGTAPGDAGYGSDARSGASNMGAGNLYQ